MPSHIAASDSIPVHGEGPQLQTSSSQLSATVPFAPQSGPDLRSFSLAGGKEQAKAG